MRESRTSFAAALLGCLLAAQQAGAAAWTAPQDDLVVNHSTIVDSYQFYARNSTNSKLLQEPAGSIVQAGDVRRFGFLLGAEYGLTERVTASANLAYFYTQHVAVGENVAFFTNSQPNTQMGLQDLTGNVKYLALQLQGAATDGPPKWMLGVAPYLGWTLPLSKYDTSLNNPLGDGIVSVDLAVSASLALPGARVFVNADAIYRAREDKAVRVGNVWPEDVVLANPDAPIQKGGQIHDQVQGTVEAGFFLTDAISIRGVVRRIETLGGENLTFEGMPDMMKLNIGKQSMFENSLAYDQDALFVGGGPYWQVNDYFGFGATYVHAIWFRNFPNMKTLVVSLNFNPQLAKRKAERLEREAKALEEAAAAEEAEGEAAAAPEG